MAEELQQDLPLPTLGEALTPEPAPSPEPAPEPPKPEPEPAPPPEPGIPSWRLREEAEARRQAEDRARALDQRLREITAHVQQQQKPPDFFENPSQATQMLIAHAIQPFVEESRRQADDYRRGLMYMGKMVASSLHGEDKVDAAEQEFLKQMRAETLDPADYERVVQSPNRYDAVVQWHKRQSVLSSVGDDPAAWFEKQLESRMADPTFQAKMLERVQAGAAGRPPMTRLPPTLSKSTAAADNAAPLGDLSDASLFRNAMKR